MLDLLLKAGDDVERAEAEKTVAALLQKIGSPDDRSRLVRMRLAAEKDADCPGDAHRPAPARRRTTARCPSCGRALADADTGVADAAARAIAAWPTATARDDMLKILRESKDETHRLLAIGGLVRLVSLDANRLPEAAVADLKEAVGLGVEAGRAETDTWRPGRVPVPGRAGPGQRVPEGRSAQGRGAGGDRRDHAGDAAARPR